MLLIYNARVIYSPISLDDVVCRDPSRAPVLPTRRALQPHPPLSAPEASRNSAVMGSLAKLKTGLGNRDGATLKIGFGGKDEMGRL